MTLADGVSAAWYEQTPVSPSPAKMGRAVVARAAAYPADSVQPLFWWNAVFVRDHVCGHKDGPPGTEDKTLVFQIELVGVDG